MILEELSMLARQVKKYLDSNKVDYSVINHSPAYTASQTAQAAHISGKQMAKVVIAKVDGNYCMFAIPAHTQLDFDTVQKKTKAKNVELAHEYEFNQKFSDCDVGAMPPFGDLYGMEVYLADSLKNQDWLVFNGGNHSELIRMNCNDFLKLAHPKFLPKCKKNY